MGNTSIKPGIASKLEYKMPIKIISGFDKVLKEGYREEQSEEEKTVITRGNEEKPKTAISGTIPSMMISTEGDAKLIDIQTVHEDLKQIEELVEENNDYLNKIPTEEEPSMTASNFKPFPSIKENLSEEFDRGNTFKEDQELSNRQELSMRENSVRNETVSSQQSMKDELPIKLYSIRNEEAINEMSLNEEHSSRNHIDKEDNALEDPVPLNPKLSDLEELLSQGPSNVPVYEAESLREETKNKTEIPLEDSQESGIQKDLQSLL